jgi:dihydroorotase
LKNGELVNHMGRGAGDVGVIAGKIAAIGDLKTASAGEVIDCTGLTVLPGVIDAEVHFREPGREHKEDLETGSRAAALGGVVALFEMPNTDPATTTVDALNDKIRRAHHRMHTDFAFLCWRCGRQCRRSGGDGQRARLLRCEDFHGRVHGIFAGQRRSRC